MEKQMASLGFTYDDGYYFKDMVTFEIWVRKEILITQDDDVVKLGVYDYERLKKLISIFAI